MTTPAQFELFAPHHPSTPRVVFSYGMGADSTAILLRWLHDPSSRDFDLDELVLITSMVGDEFAQTRIDVTEAVLPRLREFGVRFIQVGRSQRTVTRAGDGLAVFDDSRHPEHLYFAGDYTLSTELLTAGTVPQLGGSRRCSLRSKAACLEPVIAKITAGQPYRHVIGYQADELGRARKDSLYNTELRTGWYPLIEWGYTRQDCLDLIEQLTGRRWMRSACGFCPFALATSRGRAETFARYRAEPDRAIQALTMEHVSLALNERQGLIGDRRLIDEIRAAGLHDITAQFEDYILTVPHAVYDVRRVIRPRPADPTKPGTAVRSVTQLDTGTQEAMAHALTDMPGVLHHGPTGIPSKVLRRREDTPAYPQLEHFYVAAPAVVDTKAGPGFDQAWQAATAAAIF
ncbi:hypothetical protein [Mycolicibacterium mageritense]|uniref:hypothetical protein n=1 Tax=Mycolicibacterium mageritense TaxID=53462 RepID=UPI001E5C912C|nr:hypothetical protein [Mycolicibacterium mageritense]MCC9186698.1 hypothetical protein [Mycolicibacterium mageritense]